MTTALIHIPPDTFTWLDYFPEPEDNAELDELYDFLVAPYCGE